MITTSSVDAAHGLLAIVQRKVTEVPADIPVTVDVGEEGVVMVAVPAINDQLPVPIAGAFAASVVDVTLHKF